MSVTALDAEELEERLRDARRALLAARCCSRAIRCSAPCARTPSGCARSSSASSATSSSSARATPGCASARDELRTDRPARIPRAGHPDTWQPFTRRHYVLFALALAACERARVQTSIGLLAEEVRSLAAEEGIELDLDRLDDRRCLADVFHFLSTLGVLVPVAGQAESWVRSRAEGDDELLYDVMHSALDDLIVAPRVVGAADARDLLYGGVYPASEEGAQPGAQAPGLAAAGGGPGAVPVRALRRRSRALREGPRPRDAALADWLGLEAERRREGTALIDGDFEPLTDLRFPAARPWTRQVALLLAERICQRVRGGQSRVSDAELVSDCAALRERWGDALCGEEPEEMAVRGRGDPRGDAARPPRGLRRAAAARDRPPQPRRHDRARTATSGGRMTDASRSCAAG